MALMLVLLIPFSPMLSFVFYVVSDEESTLAKLIKKNPICCMSFSPRNYDDKNISEFRKWMEEKLDKHIGFMYVANLSL